MVSFRRRASTPTPTMTESDSDRLLATRGRGLGLFGRRNRDSDTSSDRSGEGAPPPKSARALSPFKRLTKKEVEKPTEVKPDRPVVRMIKPKKGERRARSMSPLKRMAGKDSKEIGTPPVTPDKDDPVDDTPLHVKLVTVKVQPPEPGSDVSVMSDLTDNRTYKRLADYKQSLKEEQDAEKQRQAVKEAEAAASAELSAIPEENEKVPSVKARMQKVQAAQKDGEAMQGPSEQQAQGQKEGEEDTNPMAFLFSYMDRACTPQADQRSGINKSYSFVPEWGLAPSRDERDKNACLDNAVLDSIDEGDDDIRQPPRRVPPPRVATEEIHENFEMVLEDLASTEEDLEQIKQQRNWMSALSFRKNAEKSEERDGASPAMDESTRAVKATKTQRNVPPLTVEEEEKKEEEYLEIESDGDEEPAKGPTGARKMGSKFLKSFRRLKKLKGDLPPVSEEEELDPANPPDTKEGEIHIPQINKTISEDELIGDNVVEGIYRDLEASMESTTPTKYVVQTHEEKTKPPGPVPRAGRSESPLSQSSTIPSKEQTRSSDGNDESATGDGEATNMVTSIMSLLGGGGQTELPPEVNTIPDKGDIPKSKSWVDQFRLTMSEDTYDVPPSAKELGSSDRLSPKLKMAWRETSDPKTGRPYYYHRVTREVTWTKPDELIDYERKRGVADKDDDRRLVPVLSDGDLAAASKRDSKAESEAVVRKKNARDFDPHVWAIKGQIVKLLQTMEPPDGKSVEDILKQYEGREEMLLQQLHGIKEALPFDEPMAGRNDATVDAGENKEVTFAKAEKSKTEKTKTKRLKPGTPRTRSDPPQNKADRSKSAPRLRHVASSLRRTNSKKEKSQESNGASASKKAEAERPEPVHVEKKLVQEEDQDQIEPTTSFDPPAQEPSRDEGDAPEARKKIDTATRNVARAMRARLAARRANSAPPRPKQDKENKSSDNHPLDESDAALADSATHGTYEPAALKNRVRTSGSGVTSKQSEKTELIRNTAKRQNTLNTLGEVRTVGSDVTSLSSTGLEPRITVPMPSNPAPIPGKITAPRTRELMVEEFSMTDRSYRSELYDTKRTVRAGRFGTTGTRRKPFTTPSPTLRDGDDSNQTDSVSALSVDENSKPLYQKGSTDYARRRALDEAVARGDWDLAAALSDAMRTLEAKRVMQPSPAEWKQSELDRFISQNDWDAVANYIASVRAKVKQSEKSTAALPRTPVQAVQAVLPSSKRASRRRPQPHPAANLYDESDELMNGNPTKRFGARSQLQHSEIHSESSWDSEDSSYFTEDYSSASSISEPSARRGKNRYRYASKHSRPVKNDTNKPKEFAC